MPMKIVLLELPLEGSKTARFIVAGEGPEICYIVGPGSFYLKGLAHLCKQFTFVTCDGLWAHYKKDKVDEDVIQSTTLDDLIVHDRLAIKAIKAHFKRSKIGLLGFSGPGALALLHARDVPEDIAWVNGSGVALCPLDPSFSATDKVFKEKASPERLADFESRQKNYQKLTQGDEDAKPLARSNFFTDPKTNKRRLSVNSDYLEQVRFLAPKLVYDPGYEYACYIHWENNPLGQIVNQPLRVHFFMTMQAKLDAPALLKQLQAQGKVPILIINGKDDFITPMDAKIEAEVRGYKRVTVKTYDHCGHLPYLEAAEDYAKDFCAFVASLTPSYSIVERGSKKPGQSTAVAGNPYALQSSGQSFQRSKL